MSYKEPFELRYPATIRPEILKDFELSDRDKLVYAVISSLIGGKETPCWLTDAEIGEACGKELRAIQRAIKNLKEKDYIYIDLDRKRATKNKAIRHIYTDLKYYNNRNNKAPALPKKFKNIHHFRNWAKYALVDMPFTHIKANKNTIRCVINKAGYIHNIGLDEQLHSINDKTEIYKIWQNLYDDKETVIEAYKAKNKLNKKDDK